MIYISLNHYVCRVFIMCGLCIIIENSLKKQIVSLSEKLKIKIIFH